MSNARTANHLPRGAAQAGRPRKRLRAWLWALLTLALIGSMAVALSGDFPASPQPSR
jgi:hypothetical protein